MIYVEKKVLDTGVPSAYNALLFLSKPERSRGTQELAVQGAPPRGNLRHKSRNHVPKTTIFRIKRIFIENSVAIYDVGVERILIA